MRALQRNRSETTLSSLSILLLSVAGATAAQVQDADLRLNELTVDNSIVPVDQVLKGGPPRDGIPALTHPEVLDAGSAAFMRPDDLVIGVQLNGEARAYPLRIMAWHELVNDRVGGQDILVTYCPLCRSTLVFDRRVDGVVREFGVSGLLYNSNVLMYSRALTLDQSSLWSQGQLRAVVGPDAKAGRTLRLLPSVLTTWSHWLKSHPSSSVLSNQTGHDRDGYQEEPYEDYFEHSELKFPVFDTDLEDRPERFEIKEPMILVQVDKSWKAYAVKDVARAAGEQGWFTDSVGELPVLLSYDRDSNSVNVGPQGRPEQFAMAHLYWFAIRALRPDVEIFQPEGIDEVLDDWWSESIQPEDLSRILEHLDL